MKICSDWFVKNEQVASGRYIAYHQQNTHLSRQRNKWMNARDMHWSSNNILAVWPRERKRRSRHSQAEKGSEGWTIQLIGFVSVTVGEQIRFSPSKVTFTHQSMHCRLSSSSFRRPYLLLMPCHQPSITAVVGLVAGSSKEWVQGEVTSRR